MYRVPKLEYDREDLGVEFSLSLVRGLQPDLYGMFCTVTDKEKCRD